MGYWDENHLLWQKEGLPPGLDTNQKLNLFFGLEERHPVSIDCRVRPSFKIEEVEVKDGYRYYYDGFHVLCRVLDDGLTIMPEHLDYPLKTRSDWENIIKPRYNPSTPGRVPENLTAQVDEILSHNFFTWIEIGSLFGLIRNFAGFEQICYMVHDDPELIDDIIQHMADLTCATLEQALPRVKGKIAYVQFWEDMCFNSGPIVSPEFFQQRMIPRYKQVTSVVHAQGIDTIVVDTDGWIGPLVESWLDAGVNVMYPLERKGGSDPVILRKQYGRDLLLKGGVSKMAIAKGGDAIIRELEYLAPLVHEGGFIPHCDHYCPADVSLDNYRFYLKKKREIFGMPQREERIRIYPDDYPQ
jgi:uroporphyrinogen decarboxylase